MCWTLPAQHQTERQTACSLGKKAEHVIIKDPNVFCFYQGNKLAPKEERILHLHLYLFRTQT